MEQLKIPLGPCHHSRRDVVHDLLCDSFAQRVRTVHGRDHDAQKEKRLSVSEANGRLAVCNQHKRELRHQVELEDHQQALSLGFTQKASIHDRRLALGNRAGRRIETMGWVLGSI